MYIILGFYPKPHFIFFLDKKNEAKKVKTSPASLKKLALGRLKSSKLLPSVVKQGVFLGLPHLFFGSPDEVGREHPFSTFY
jgi:hypothetical protein